MKVAADGSKIVVVQTRSQIGREPSILKTLKSLGLGRIGKRREFVLNPALRGLLKRVEHIIDVTMKEKA